MSELRRVVVTVKNFETGDYSSEASAYNRVRAIDESGNTIYFKALIVPSYLVGKGAMNKDVPRTWYVKNTARNVTVIVGYETPSGKFEYDPDEVKIISRGSIGLGLKFGILAVPVSIVLGIASYGVGLLALPFILYYAYRHIFAIPAMLGQKRLAEDFSKFGLTI